MGVSVLRVQTDNGTEFTLPRNERTLLAYIRGEVSESLFTKVAIENGIQHRLIRPYSPQLNSKVERSHRIDEERFYSRYSFDSEFSHDHALKIIWTPEYNERRPHGALGNKTPMEFLKQRLREIQEKKLHFLNNTFTRSDEKKAA